jgi:23S rRNA pseudouridine955/2504/2580 synthase
MLYNDEMELITGENDKGRRLDRILRKALPDHPLPLIHRLMRQGFVLVNGKPGKAHDRIDTGMKILIKRLSPKQIKAKEDYKAENRSQNPASALSYNEILKTPRLNVIWEDSGLLAVNKPPGIAVHGPNSLDTLVNSYLADKLPPSLSFKSGPLHRLDKPSSGIVVFSASIEGARLFSSLMHERKVRKTYLAIVEGNVEKEEIWQDKLVRNTEKKKTFVSETDDGKPAITKVIPLAAKNNFSLVKAEIITGRTHQIRAQAAAHGYPLAGDIKYGGKGKSGIYLHAWKLEFMDYNIEAPLFVEFERKIKTLFELLKL